MSSGNYKDITTGYYIVAEMKKELKELKGDFEV